MLYQVYRPTKFEEVIGQGANAEILKRQIVNNTVAHSYLFEGNRGSGKTTSARILAKALNCQRPLNGEPCCSCESCLSIDKGNSQDVIELDAASNNGVDNIRNIINSMQYAPNGKYKIYIIDEAHMLSNSAANAFLKILEEPPVYGVFILCTTEARKLPITILSRCQKFTFNRIRTNDILSRLNFINAKENAGIEEKALSLIAKLADGALRDALSLMELVITSGKRTYGDVCQVTGVTTNSICFSILDALIKRDSKSAIENFYNVLENGMNIESFVNELIEISRNLMVLKAGADTRIISMADEDINVIQGFANVISFDEILNILDILQETQSKFKVTSYVSTLVEMAFIKITRVKSISNCDNNEYQTNNVQEQEVIREQHQQVEEVINAPELQAVTDNIISVLKSHENANIQRVGNIIDRAAVIQDDDYKAINIYCDSSEDGDYLTLFENNKNYLSTQYSQAFNKQMQVFIY
ncbi:MAG: DNA polymerase III subunit gamma/tau [Clostridium sp.]